MTRYYSKEEDIPLCEIEKDDGMVEHLLCYGSRRHVVSYSENGCRCSVNRCEINKVREGGE